MPFPWERALPVSHELSTSSRACRAPSVAEFPFYGERIAFRCTRSTWSLRRTHWKPLVNGYSDYIPQDFRDAAVVARFLSVARQLRGPEKHRVRYIGIHWDMYGPRAGRDRGCRLQPTCDAVPDEPVLSASRTGRAIRSNFARNRSRFVSMRGLTVTAHVRCATFFTVASSRGFPTDCFVGGRLLLAGVFFLRRRGGAFFLAVDFCGRQPAPSSGVSVEMVRGIGCRPDTAEPVVFRGAEDPLHVVLRLGKRDVVDELVLVEPGTLRLPPDDAAVARVVAGKRVVGAAELLDQLREVSVPEPDVDLGVGQRRRREARRPSDARQLSPGRRHELHQPPGVG